MSLNFSGAGDRYVTYTADAAYNNLTQGSAFFVVRSNSATPGGTFITKKNIGSAETIRVPARGNGNFAIIVARASAQQEVDSTGAPIIAGINMCAATWNTDGGSPNVYHGTLTSVMANVNGTQVDGSGAQTDDSGNDWRVGARPGSSSWGGKFDGDIGIAMLFNRELTVDDFKILQHRPLPFDDSCVMYTILGLHGTGTQPDLCGKGNNGTVTGATLADPAPLPPLFGLDAFSGLYVPVAGAVDKSDTDSFTMTAAVPDIAPGGSNTQEGGTLGESSTVAADADDSDSGTLSVVPAIAFPASDSGNLGEGGSIGAVLDDETDTGTLSEDELLAAVLSDSETFTFTEAATAGEANEPTDSDSGTLSVTEVIEVTLVASDAATLSADEALAAVLADTDAATCATATSLDQGALAGVLSGTASLAPRTVATATLAARTTGTATIKPRTDGTASVFP